MITFVDKDKTRKKRDPGRCFLRAGFKNVGETKGGLVALQLLPQDMPKLVYPHESADAYRNWLTEDPFAEEDLFA